MRLVYFSPVPWISFSQRSHKFVEWLHARQGGEVLWVDPYPTRLPAMADFQRLKTEREIALKLSINGNTPAWLTILRPRSLPIEPLPGIGALNRLLWNDVLRAIDVFVGKGECLLGIGKPSRLALLALDRHPAVPSFYDAMDNFPAFYQGMSRESMEKREREVASRATRILISSTRLTDRFVPYRAKLVLTYNACAVDALPTINAVRKKSGKPVLGYVGTIGHWFDWALIFSLAEANPSMCIRLIGPTYILPPDPVPANVELLPACGHANAITAMREFSVGLIPFKCIDLTACVDPVKYYEYRALGLPVLSSRFGEMALRGGLPGVFLTDEHADLATQVKMAMAYECNINELQKFRSENSWEARFEASGILS